MLARKFQGVGGIEKKIINEEKKGGLYFLTQTTDTQQCILKLQDTVPRWLIVVTGRGYILVLLAAVMHVESNLHVRVYKCCMYRYIIVEPLLSQIFEAIMKCVI